MKRLALIAFITLFVGCSTTPEVVEYDPENDVMPGMEEAPIGPTPDLVIAAKHKGVIVEVMRDHMYNDEIDDIDIQQWLVVVGNKTYRDKCVGIIWRLMDFQFISEYPTTVNVPAREHMILGVMRGKTMLIDGVLVAPPPSGYVHAMQVFKPNRDAEPGFECMQLDTEEDVIPEKYIMER